ncbi:MAG: DUF1844 domain-containing protein [Verrucomicrobiia bacterium]
MAEIQKDKIGSTEDTLRFLDLVGLFNTQAMITLGKLANPATGKAEKNLPAARLFIDMLEMLERKTQNNLTSDETKILRTSLTDLRMMFVEESKSPSAEQPSPQKTESQPSASAEQPQPDGAEPKFHKKYD